MRLIIVGCEYSGTTSLAYAVCRWAEDVMGGSFEFHDHWKFPHIGFDPLDHTASSFTEEEQRQILALSPVMKEMMARYSIVAHEPTDDTPADYILVGFYFDDTVYSSLYFGYGAGDEDPFIQGGPRSAYSRGIEKNRIMKSTPDTVLVLVKASPEVIARRMKEDPHQNGVLQEKDITHVLQKFEEEYDASLISQKFTLDTTTATAKETLAAFVEQMEPLLTDTDRLRINSHPAYRKA